MRKKKPHTEIKHAIFLEALKASLYVANMNVRADDEAFTYVDLFAGRGDFEDQARGFPVITLMSWSDTFCRSQPQVINSTRYELSQWIRTQR